MEHLYSSIVRVKRISAVSEDGGLELSWNVVPQLQSVSCRLDLNFLRPCKDQLSPVVDGRAPDRVGVMFCSSSVPLRPGDHLETVSGPVTGTFQIRAIPDQALDYGSAHHIEVQVIEVSQDVSPYKFDIVEG